MSHNRMGKRKTEASVKSYLFGFIVSVILTLEAFALVQNHHLAKWTTIFIISALAVTQLMIQLYFFLHVGSETKPRLKLVTFLFAGLVVLIVVFGSFWIMSNLNYHHSGHNGHAANQPPDTYIIHDEGIH